MRIQYRPYFAAGLLCVCVSTSVRAQSSAFTYQGQLHDGDSPANGVYEMTFRLHSAANGGLLAGAPITNSAVVVSNGLFTALLDFGAAPFSSQDRWLSVAVRTNGGGSFEILDPRQPITPTPFAITASKVPDETITSGMITNDAITRAKLVDGAVGEREIATDAVITSKIEDDAVTGAKVAANSIGSRALADDAVDTAALQDGAVTNLKLADAAVSSRKLASSVILGEGSTSGGLTVWNGDDSQPGVELLGQSRRVMVYGADGVPRGSLDAASAGKLSLNSTAGTPSISLDADDGIESTGPVEVVSAIAGTANVALSRTGNGGQVITSDENGTTTSQLGAGIAGGFVQLNQAGGQPGLLADGDANNNSGATLTLYQGDSDVGIFADGDSGGAGLFQVRGTNGVTRVTLDGDDNSGDGASGGMTIYGSNGAEMYRVSEHQQGALLELSNTYLATPRFRLESGWIDDGSSITLYTAGGLRGANLEAQEASGFSSGGLLELRDVSESGSQVVVRLRGQVGSTNQIFNATFMESLGINRYGSSNELEVGGDASKSAAGDWLANSDARIKTEVTTVRNALQTLNQVRPVTFHYRPEYLEQHPELRDIEYYNVIAQEFAEVFPHSVSEGGDTLSSGERVLQVDTHPAMMTALAAVQELHALVQAQEQRIAELESRLDPKPDQSHTSDLAQKGEFQ